MTKTNDNQVAIRTEERAIVMKSGVIMWVSKETGERIDDHLEKQSGHTFVRIRELGQTINTAQVEGVYTQETYADYVKVKKGMWQCEFREWHDRKDICKCRQERARVSAQRMRDAEYDEELTPEQEATRKELVKKHREKLIINGTLMRQRGSTPVRRSTIVEYQQEHPNDRINLEGVQVIEDQ